MSDFTFGPSSNPASNTGFVLNPKQTLNPTMSTPNAVTIPVVAPLTSSVGKIGSGPAVNKDTDKKNTCTFEKRRKKKTPSFKTYIKRILKKKKGDLEIQRRLCMILEDMAKKVIVLIINKCTDIAGGSGTKQIQPKLVGYAIKFCLDSKDLADACAQKAKEAINTYDKKRTDHDQDPKEVTDRKRGKRLKPMSMSKLSGIIIPPAKIRGIWKKLAPGYITVINRASAIYVAACVEVVIEELLDKCIAALDEMNERTSGNKSHLLTANHLINGFRIWRSMSNLFQGVIRGGGMIGSFIPERINQINEHMSEAEYQQEAKNYYLKKKGKPRGSKKQKKKNTKGDDTDGSQSEEY